MGNCERCHKEESQYEICETCWLDYTRLCNGELTEEELQNLCHNLKLDDQCAFEKGCLEFQKKIFGHSKTELELVGLRNRVKELKQYELFYKMIMNLVGFLR